MASLLIVRIAIDAGERHLVPELCHTLSTIRLLFVRDAQRFAGLVHEGLVTDDVEDASRSICYRVDSDGTRLPRLSGLKVFLVALFRYDLVINSLECTLLSRGIK